MSTDEEQMRDASKNSAKKARKLLDMEVKTVMDKIARIDELKPKTTDEGTLDKLIEEIKKAKDRNDSSTTLIENVNKLGDSAVFLFRKIINNAKDLK